MNSGINTFRQKGTVAGARVTLNKEKRIKAMPPFTKCTKFSTETALRAMNTEKEMNKVT
jgi:hypothetical protein